jgi:DNA topoisomerase-1
MRTAQRLYEGIEIDGEAVGLITYMRTDGVSISNDAITSARQMIDKQYGAQYRPDEPRIYKTQAKNAQEAHEAIRPTDMFRRPDDLPQHLDPDQRRLYELVWKRAVASQMSSAVIDQVAVDLVPPDNGVTLRATGSTIVFDGFLTLYHEDTDEPDEDEENRRLPPLNERDALSRGEVKPLQHFTQPPPRFTEASLVKRLEELGIGRPSTYASTMQVLQDRKYVLLDKKRLLPEDRGRLVTAFLKEYFNRYVQYDFTADLENKLDDISGGRIAWRKVLEDFWRDFTAAIAGTKDLNITQVIDALDADLGQHFFPPRADGTDPRLCPVCKEGRLGLKLGRFGAFIGCSKYPECRYTRPLAIESGDPLANEPRAIGIDPVTSLPVTLKKGPYGPYVQLGDTPPKPEKRKKGEKRPKGEAKPPELPKPKRASIPKGISPADIDLDMALKLLALPRDVGPHPEDGEIIIANNGRFGPYIKHGKLFKSLAPDDDVLTIGLNRAVVLLAEPRKFRRGAPEPIKELGEHPHEGGPVKVFDGKYGPYVSHDGINATLPGDIAPAELTMDRAVDLLAERAARTGGGKKKKTKAKIKAKPAADEAKGPSKGVKKPSKKKPPGATPEAAD